MLDGALQIVADGQHVAGEIGDGIARRVGLLPLGATAEIFHVGHGAEQPVAHIRVLREQRGQIGADLRARIGAGILRSSLSGGGSCLIPVGLTRIG